MLWIARMREVVQLPVPLAFDLGFASAVKPNKYVKEKKKEERKFWIKKKERKKIGKGMI